MHLFQASILSLMNVRVFDIRVMSEVELPSVLSTCKILYRYQSQIYRQAHSRRWCQCMSKLSAKCDARRAPYCSCAMHTLRMSKERSLTGRFSTVVSFWSWFTAILKKLAKTYAPYAHAQYVAALNSQFTLPRIIAHEQWGGRKFSYPPSAHTQQLHSIASSVSLRMSNGAGGTLLNPQ